MAASAQQSVSQISLRPSAGESRSTKHQAVPHFHLTNFPPQVITTVSRKGEKMRCLDLTSADPVLVQVTQDLTEQPMLLINSPETHDLVLEFDNTSDRKRFLVKLEAFLAGFTKNLEVNAISKETLLVNAETKERREKRLEHFFREAYAITFGLKSGGSRSDHEPWVGTDTVMTTSLTQEEFASALGMKKNEMFVRKMFNIVDKDKDGRISFQEFLDTVVLFTKGQSDDKLMIIFKMCDDDNNGMVDKAEFKDMLKSLIEIAKTERIHDDDVSELINSMFKSAGLQDQGKLSYEDFKKLMNEFKGDFLSVGLDCKGVKQNFLETSSNVARMTTFAVDGMSELKARRPWILRKYDTAIAYLEENRQPIFYVVVFYVITFALFAERFIRKILSPILRQHL